MKSITEKIQMPPAKFALWALRARFKTQACPMCASTRYQHLQRKKIVVESKKCLDCDIIFRWPVDDPGIPAQYQLDRQGFDESIPSETALTPLLANNFLNTPYDFSRYLSTFSQVLPAPAKVLNFGASWGYMSEQLKREGYEVISLEMDPERFEFSKKNLRGSFFQTWEAMSSALKTPLDGIFSNHLLCHASHPGETFELFHNALRPEGILMLIVPNAKGPSARKLGISWGSFLGQTHPVAYFPEWFRGQFKKLGFLPLKIFSLPENQDDVICVAKKI